MASENEKVMDVLEEMRVCATAADPTIWGDARIAQLVITTKKQQLEYLGRLEAAWKREYDILNSEREKCRLYGLTEHDKVLKLMAKLKSVGNAAAMREALVKIENIACVAVENGTMEHPQYSKIVGIVESALAAPPRNCENFTTVEDAYEKYMGVPMRTMNYFAKWLLDTVKETEVPDGSK